MLGESAICGAAIDGAGEDTGGAVVFARLAVSPSVGVAFDSVPAVSAVADGMGGG